MPKDPKALLSLARGVNGLSSLSSPNMKPWHVKYLYQTFDSDGKAANQGSFEEWWISPDSYKSTWTSEHLNQTEYHTKNGVFLSGDQASPSAAELTLLRRITAPIPPESKLAGYTIVHRGNPFPHANLVCVATEGGLANVSPETPASLFPLYCFDQDKPVLRASGSFGTHTSVYQHTGSLAGHYLAAELQVTDAGKNYAAARLVEGNILPAASEADVQPPADAVAEAPRTIAVSAGMMKTRKLSGDNPVYPVGAKQDRTQGTVVLAVRVGEDGAVQELNVISAPDYRLAVSAMIAVRTWKYQPYLLNGKPVSVETQINVIYTIGG